MKDMAVAVDVGTTTLAATLIDRSSGARLAQASSRNPQAAYGADVITRLDAATRSPATAREMSRILNRAVENLVHELVAAAAIAPATPSLVAIAGNPAMEHLLLGLPIHSLARLPYRPLFTNGRRVAGSELGWKTDFPLYLFPLAGAFVGGDIVAFLNAFPATDVRLYIDLGTNGEMALSSDGKIYATSAAAGPAFEGGNLSCGMAAVDGAISRVAIDGDNLSLETIGGAPPAGICGSGVVDALAGLLQSGVIDRTGRILPPSEIPNNLANRVVDLQGERAFVLYRDARMTVHLSQKDVREFQLAKSAVVAGIQVLLRRAGLSFDALESIILTGSFGSRLDPTSLKTVGFMTQKMVKITRFVCEGVVAGVEKTLSEKDGFAKVESLAQQLSVLPLSGNPLFEQFFMQHMNFAALAPE